MNTCKTCKWHQNGQTKYNRADLSNGGWCECPKLYEADCAPAGEPEFGRDHLRYVYNESGGFWTGDDFGCVHHCANIRDEPRAQNL